MSRRQTVEDVIADYTRTLAFKRAVADLKARGDTALCLVGPPRPVPDWNGGNALRWPVALRINKDPDKAGQRDASSHWEGSRGAPHVVTLEHVRLTSSAAADRLGDRLYARLLGDDAQMRQLNASWIDLMEWEIAWPILLKDAIADVHAGGERIEVYSEEMWTHRAIRHSRQRIRT